MIQDAISDIQDLLEKHMLLQRMLESIDERENDNILLRSYLDLPIQEYNGEYNRDPYQALIGIELKFNKKIKIENFAVFNAFIEGRKHFWQSFPSLDQVFAIDQKTYEDAPPYEMFLMCCIDLNISLNISYKSTYGLLTPIKQLRNYVFKQLWTMHKSRPTLFNDLFKKNPCKFIGCIEFAKNEALKQFMKKCFSKNAEDDPQNYAKDLDNFVKMLKDAQRTEMFMR